MLYMRTKVVGYKKVMTDKTVWKNMTISVYSMSSYLFIMWIHIHTHTRMSNAVPFSQQSRVVSENEHSVVVQWLGLRAWVQSPAGALRSCKPCSAARENWRQRTTSSWQAALHIFSLSPDPLSPLHLPIPRRLTSTSYITRHLLTGLRVDLATERI